MNIPPHKFVLKSSCKILFQSLIETKILHKDCVVNNDFTELIFHAYSVEKFSFKTNLSDLFIKSLYLQLKYLIEHHHGFLYYDLNCFYIINETSLIYLDVDSLYRTIKPKTNLIRINNYLNIYCNPNKFIFSKKLKNIKSIPCLIDNSIWYKSFAQLLICLLLKNKKEEEKEEDLSFKIYENEDEKMNIHLLNVIEKSKYVNTPVYFLIKRCLLENVLLFI